MKQLVFGACVAAAAFAVVTFAQPEGQPAAPPFGMKTPSFEAISAGLKEGDTVDLVVVRANTFGYSDVQVTNIDAVGLRFRRTYKRTTVTPDGKMGSLWRESEHWLPWTQVQSIEKRLSESAPTLDPAK
jgi:hypothetical protein